MQLRSDSTRYGSVAMLLHWIIASLVLFMLWFGHYISDLPKNSAWRQEALHWHHSLGLTVLILTVIRIAWRLFNRGPDPMPTMRGWELWLMKTVHYWFYIILVLLPLAGWAAASTSPLDNSINFYNFFQWPSFLGMPRRADFNDVFFEMHEFLGHVMIALIVIHLLGVLKHTFVTKDKILKRILPL